MAEQTFETIDRNDFSGSVRDVRDGLGPSAIVTASQIVAALQERHPEYGRKTFKAVQLHQSEGRTAATDNWLHQVRELYDLSEVKETRHEVIDGELVVLGLAELDPSLAGDLKAEGFLDALKESVQILPRRSTTDRTAWATDAPAEIDLLGRDRLAEALVERVRRLSAPDSKSRRSFLIHIDGPWGSGKSTLFGFLERRLQDADFVVVSLNAWREQRVGVQWWTLLRALRRTITQRARWYQRPRLWLADLGDRIRAGWVPFIAAMLVLAALLSGLLLVTDLNLTASRELADSILKVASLASVAFAGLITAARYLLPASRKSARGFEDTSDNPMQEVGRLFARSLARAEDPVVFLIDDLDRCDEDYVVEFLEVVQTLVRDAPTHLAMSGTSASPKRRPLAVEAPAQMESLAQPTGRTHKAKRADVAGPYVFIAADGQWIRSSYEKHYGTFTQTAAPGRPLGYLFQEKIFQLHVRLPSITPRAKEAFLASLLIRNPSRSYLNLEQQQVLAEEIGTAVAGATTGDEITGAVSRVLDIADPTTRMRLLGDAAVRFSEPAIEDATEHELTPFARFLEPNPRSMKLFVNTYGVLRSLRTLEENFVSTEPLALWTVIEIRWPYLADRLRLDPDIVGRSDDDLPPDLRPLLADKEVRAVLRDGPSGPLTSGFIRASSGSP